MNIKVDKIRTNKTCLYSILPKKKKKINAIEVCVAAI